MDINEIAKNLEIEINDEIAIRCQSVSFLAWESIAEQVADEKLDLDRWEYRTLNIIGKPPQVRITQYTPHRPPQERDYDRY